MHDRTTRSATRLVQNLRLRRTGRVAARDWEFTVLDFETNARRPGRVLEIGAVRVRGDGTVLGELSTLVDPGPDVDVGPTWVHRIRREHLVGAPSMAEVLGDLLELCRDSILVAHNLPFDERFLAHEIALLGVELPTLPGVCTLDGVREAVPLSNYQLGAVAAELGLPVTASHVALDDAYVCAHLLVALVNEYGLRLDAEPRFPELPRLRTGGRLLPRSSGRAGRNGHKLVVPSLSGPAPSDPATSLDPVASDPAVVDPSRERSGTTERPTSGKRSRTARTRQNRPKRIRAVVVGTSPEAEELRTLLEAKGHQIARNLTATVTHLVVDGTRPLDVRRRRRAAELGVPVVTPAELRRYLAGGRARSAAAARSGSGSVTVVENGGSGKKVRRPEAVPATNGAGPSPEPSPAEELDHAAGSEGDRGRDDRPGEPEPVDGEQEPAHDVAEVAGPPAARSGAPDDPDTASSGQTVWVPPQPAAEHREEPAAATVEDLPVAAGSRRVRHWVSGVLLGVGCLLFLLILIVSLGGAR